MKSHFVELTCFVLVVTILFTLCPFAYASSGNTRGYTDVSEDFWAYNDINLCSKKDWLNGYPDGTFAPNGSLTRAETIKTLAVYLQNEIKEAQTDDWYTPYINATKDILPDEWEGDNLLPDAPITREELAYLLVTALEYEIDENYTGLDSFSDKDEISAAFRPYLATALKNGLFLGNNQGEIGANDNLTRAELATLLCRAENLKAIRNKIENIVEIRVPVNEKGIAYSASGQYFTTEMTVPTEGYYKMELGYTTDNWIGYVNIKIQTPDGEKPSFLQSFMHGGTSSTFLIYLKAGTSRVNYYYHTVHTQITRLKCLGLEENFDYDISPKKATLYLDSDKQLNSYITNYTDDVVKIETAEGVNIPFEVVEPTSTILRPNCDVYPDKDAIYKLGEGTHTLYYYLKSGKILEQELKIENSTPEAELTYINFSVGKANSTLFKLPNGKYMLVDSATEAMADDIVVPYLEKNNIKLDYYLITHFHKDHVGLKDQIIETHNLTVPDAEKVTEMIKADKESRYNYLKDFTYLDSTMLCHYDELEKIWDLGGVDIEILNSRFYENGEPMEVYEYSFFKTGDHNYENTTSVSFMLDYNGFRYYHGADNYAFSQERYMSDMIRAKRTDELNCHWYFSNHHFILDWSPIFINTLNPVAVFVANISGGLSGLYNTYYKEAVENYYFEHKRLENTLISGRLGSAKVYVNSADDWCYEMISDSDLLK